MCGVNKIFSNDTNLKGCGRITRRLHYPLAHIPAKTFMLLDSPVRAVPWTTADDALKIGACTDSDRSSEQARQSRHMSDHGTIKSKLSTGSTQSCPHPLASMLGVLLSLLLLRVVLVDAAALSTVTLDYGTFTGLTNTTNGIIYFLGIRFADPPVGALRWRAPVSPPSTHLGDVNATAFGFACIGTTQKNSGATTNEDCLFGNVYIPINTTEASKLPVLVFFHGGGFETGRTADAPSENILMGSAEPLVFVTFEYRLGQFGFLAGTPVQQSGQLNVGLLDQRAALEWVQLYIAQFGGDPSRVTIWGQSAGAGSVSYHLIAEGGENKNLFTRAIGDSPPLLYLPDVTAPFIDDLFTQFAGLAGCENSGNGPAIMACLRAAPTETIATAGRNTLANLTSSLYPFGPIADGNFIRERPVEAFKNGHFVHVPVMFGSNTNEGSKWSASLPNPAANTSSPNATETTVYNFIAGQYPTFDEASFKTAIGSFYPLADYNESFSLQGQQIYGEMRYICTALMIAGVVHDAGLHAYQYHWDNPTLGSNHGDELDAFFDGDEIFDPDDQVLVTAMRQYWTSFATSGVPVAKSSPSWVPSGAEGSPRILLHPGEIAMEKVSNELTERCAFWHALASELAT
ncbi:Alpha/Beta hydrolase protein [Mycena galopus ATCC 62051]|nr:Alpha/Beta hydrolase protein [Mycena galopus ATCC 62051]